EKDSFLVRVPNEIWRNVYLVVANFIFFEYSLPFIRKKRKSILFNILIGIFLVWIQFMFLSFGLYAWRYVGIHLHIYTSLRQSTSIMDGVSYQSQGGVPSLFFFGIAKLFYDNFNLRQTTQQL